MPLPPTICAICRGPVTKDHKIVQVWVVANSPQYGVFFVEEEPEAAHVKCSDPAMPWTREDLPRTRLKKGYESMAHRLAPSHQCASCGEEFRPKDRIVELYIVEGTAFDSSVNAPGVKCAGQAEYAHLRCDDRDLTKGRSAIMIVT